MSRDISYVLAKLDWMRSERIWPNGSRYLWTDAFGLVLLTSLYLELRDRHWLEEAESLVANVERVLGRRRGMRIGEAADHDGQYFHYLTMWLFALARLGDVKPEYRARGIALARDVHRAFVMPGRGVTWKMQEDLSGPYPGVGFGAMDAYDGYVSYRLLDQDALAPEIADMRALIERDWRTLTIEQDLGLGMMLWLAHFWPQEPWATAQSARALRTLDTMWIEPPGYFCRAPWLGGTKFAFTNFGVSLGLQAANAWPARVDRLNAFFETCCSGDEYDQEAITCVMACVSHFPGAFIQSPKVG
ncbi:hypothetical protein [Bradyrhizobium sp. LHD-71]|uniref:hypothetical protein n=1 Tax=Bradyrhizobium sp. LHD-71 TaxID=3072141 RepID=UPI00280F0C86|nr:hypothetical protein [Bradyrhizobium sp. LHD-71]MDQ8729078.1 hypothetical protein [Bradyrhizobium sp. LHD-71]